MSIASRITSIEGHISDIYDSVELTGVDTTEIDKNLVNVPNTLKEGYIDIINNGTDTLYNNFPKVSGEGTSLTLNNTYQAPMRNLLKGNTSQITTTQSSNLFDEKKYLTGTFTTGTYKYALANFKGNRNLYIKAQVKSGKTAISDLFVAFTTNGTNPNSGTSHFVIRYNGVNNGSIDFTGANDIYVSFYPTSYTWQQINDVYDIWVSTNDVNYTPFVPNSPSPDYPQDVNVVSGDNAITISNQGGTDSNTYNIDLPSGMELCKIGNYQDQFKKATGKNLAPINLESETYNTLEITNNNNGTFTLLGNPTGSFGRDIATNLTLKAGTYTISANEMPSGLYIALDNEADTQLSNGTLSKTFTLASDTTYTSLGIWFTKNKDYDVTIKLQIEKSSSATEWQPMNGWYLHKEIYKKVFDGTETLSSGGSSASRTVLIYTVDENIEPYTSQTQIPNIISSHFIPVTQQASWANGNVSRATNNTKGIYFILGSGYTTETGLQWLVNNNVITYTPLATPTNEPIPSTLINQLEEFYQAQSKNNQTNISQINNDLPFIVSASALKKGV